MNGEAGEGRARPGQAWDRPDVASLGIAEVMAYIRARCPWAAAHTHTSLQKYLLEETYELLAALDAHDRHPSSETREEVVGELGDVLYQVLFHAAMLDAPAGTDETATAGEAETDVPAGTDAAADSTASAAAETSRGGPRLRADPAPPEAFTAVIERLKAKLVRRHPHVFDSDGPVDIDEVERRYEAVKVAERAAAGPERPAAAAGSSSVTRAAQARASFASVPVSMPALTRAQSVLGRIERLELELPAGVDLRADADPHTDVGLRAEGALPAEVEQEDAGNAKDPAHAIGDELFSLVTRAHQLGVDAESALRQATERAEERVIRQAQGGSRGAPGDSR